MLETECARVAALDAVPGLVHGFGRRAAGGAETRDQTRARVAAALARRGRLLCLRQVHGSRVVAAPWDTLPEADGAVVVEPGWLIGIETADCLPVLLVDPAARRAAAVHAGWRGTAAGIAGESVRSLAALGSDPGGLVAALGPAIGVCCYEVGPEVRAQLPGCGGFRPGPRGRDHLDLQAANREQLVEAGVAPERIHAVTECTACRPELYHSYRRDGSGAGRMISHVGFARG